MCGKHFCLSLPFFCTTKTSNLLVTHYFYGGIVVCTYIFFTQYFVSCVYVCFHFSLALIYTLLAVNISHFFTTVLNFHVFLPTKFVSFVFNHSL